VVSGVVGVVVVVVGVCNRSQMRTSKCTFNFWCKYRSRPILTPKIKRTKGIFDRSKFKVTRDISPTISGWLLVSSYYLSTPAAIAVYLIGISVAFVSLRV